MAEIRRDPVTDRWVIIATERAARPHDFFGGRGERKGGFCPFCEGNEDRTPPEIAAVRRPGSRPDGPGWRVRVVPNKFPALRPDAELEMRGSGLYQAVAGCGAHEVVIESPRHVVSPSEMPPEQFAAVVQMYCDRARALSADRRMAYVLVFKNVGARAGASVEHSHSQIIAVPVMPKRVHEEVRGCQEALAERGRCLFCEIVEQELRNGERVVAETDSFVALAPYASRFPFEMCVMPKYHAAHFFETSGHMVAEMALLLQEALERMEVCLKDPPYNFAIHTAPLSGAGAGDYHWHIELIPRVTRVAGFEWGTGFYINPMEPERAAQYLREVPRENLKSVTAPAAVRRPG